MLLRYTLVHCLLIVTSFKCHAQLEENKIRIEPNDSVLYTDTILQHIFSSESAIAIPAAERLYLLGHKYGSTIEMFHAACILAAHYDMLLNDQKYTLWYAKAGMLLDQMDKSTVGIYQAMYDQISPNNNPISRLELPHSTRTIQQCIAITERYIEQQHGQNSLSVYEAYNSKALFLRMMHRESEALEAYCNAFEIQRELITNTFPFLTEDERYYYWQRNFSNSMNFANYSFQESLFMHDDIITKAYDQQLMTKGILLNTTTILRRSFDRNHAWKEKWHAIGKLKKQMLDPSNDNILQLDIKANALERELMQTVDIESLKKEMAITTHDIYNAIDNNDLAVEVVEITLSANRQFFAFLCIDKQHPTPKLKALISIDTLKEMLTRDYTKDSCVYNSIWKDILSDANHVKNIYFAPSGALHTIPLEYCMTDNGTLMSERYNMYRVSSTRELAIIRNRKKNKRVVIFAGTTDSSLPYSLLEADNISKGMKACYIPKVIKGEEATVGTLKQLSGNSPQILHIATHALYEPGKTLNKSQTESDNSLLERHEDKTLSHTALLLSPLTQHSDDGICTATEISQLDLRDTDLVVLSACNTGLGQIEADGVFGLQRGFKKAGAQSMIMSLWPVNDKATMLLMTEFYRNLASHKSKTNALRRAQKFVRDYNNGYYKDKENWAGFILVDALHD